jgi:lipopolysaccharide/colanic/teichoic acid biosynthesis glycosyltransferase
MAIFHDLRQLRGEKIIDKSEIIPHSSTMFWKFKRLFDLLACLLLLPLFCIFLVIIYILNKFYNKGTVFFMQKRMGKDCKPFYAIKFRTMKPINVINRKYSDPLEIDRITPLGHLLRRYRIDELPQIINVFKGEMSLIGPRPDYYDHALFFLTNIPEYRYRHIIRPGISGLAQIRQGYAEGVDATRKKSIIDIFYIKNACLSLDIKICIGTIFTIIGGIIKKV